MLRINTKIVRERVENYLIDCAFDYCAECLEKEPSPEEIKQFIIDDINRVMGYRKKYGIMPQSAIIDYLQGLSFAIDYSYYDEWYRMNIFIERDIPIEKVSENEVYKNNERYWGLLSAVIFKWMNY